MNKIPTYTSKCQVTKYYDTNCNYSKLLNSR